MDRIENLSLEKILKTFEFAQVNKIFLRQFRNKIKNHSHDELLLFLKNHNAEMEKEKGVKIQRPFIHGFNPLEIYYQIIQESYVAGRLYDADERMLNALWSEDWQIIRSS